MYEPIRENVHVHRVIFCAHSQLEQNKYCRSFSQTSGTHFPKQREKPHKDGTRGRKVDHRPRCHYGHFKKTMIAVLIKLPTSGWKVTLKFDVRNL